MFTRISPLTQYSKVVVIRHVTNSTKVHIHDYVNACRKCCHINFTKVSASLPSWLQNFQNYNTWHLPKNLTHIFTNICAIFNFNIAFIIRMNVVKNIHFMSLFSSSRTSYLFRPTSLPMNPAYTSIDLVVATHNH